jgi:Zn-dependent oligopeptidase
MSISISISAARRMRTRSRRRRASACRCRRRSCCATGPTHFQHIFSGDHYAAGYYSYLWSEVLDADAFKAFEEAGDVFDPATAQRLRDHVYAAGGRARSGGGLTGVPRPHADRSMRC